MLYYRDNYRFTRYIRTRGRGDRYVCVFCSIGWMCGCMCMIKRKPEVVKYREGWWGRRGLGIFKHPPGWHFSGLIPSTQNNERFVFAINIRLLCEFEEFRRVSTARFSPPSRLWPSDHRHNVHRLTVWHWVSSMLNGMPTKGCVFLALRQG